jgi:hypothetical protein
LEWQAREFGKPWLIDAEHEVSRLATEMEESWWRCLGDDFAGANFNFDITGRSVEHMVIDLMSQFGWKGGELEWHLVQMCLDL